MVVCGWKGVDVQNDYEKSVFRILHGDGKLYRMRLERVLKNKTHHNDKMI
jgi:hypothetical protein